MRHGSDLATPLAQRLRRFIHMPTIALQQQAKHFCWRRTGGRIAVRFWTDGCQGRAARNPTAGLFTSSPTARQCTHNCRGSCDGRMPAKVSRCGDSGSVTQRRTGSSALTLRADATTEFSMRAVTWAPVVLLPPDQAVVVGTPSPAGETMRMLVLAAGRPLRSQSRQRRHRVATGKSAGQSAYSTASNTMLKPSPGVDRTAAGRRPAPRQRSRRGNAAEEGQRVLFRQTAVAGRQSANSMVRRSRHLHSRVWRGRR